MGLQDNSAPDFDAELASILGDEPDSTPPQGTPVPQKQEFEVGGRKFGSFEEVQKWGNALMKDYTKKSQMAARVKEVEEFERLVSQHPELRQSLQKTIDEYVARRKSGQSETQAQKATQLPDEVVSKLERLDDLEARLDDWALEREIDSIRKEFNLDDSTVAKVLEASATVYGGLDLASTYKLLAFDEKIRAAKRAGAQETAQALQSKRQAMLAGGPAPAEAGSRGPNAKSVNSDAVLDQMLSQFGYK